jgi:hypothetical protein
MIKGLTGSRGIAVSGGNTSLPYVGPNTSNPLTGMLRVNNTGLEVFDGSCWQIIPSSYATVTLDTETLLLLEWARKKKREEEVLASLPNDNTAVKLARQNINRIKQELAQAEEQLKITEILTHEETTS